MHNTNERIIKMNTWQMSELHLQMVTPHWPATWPDAEDWK
jgi:hypothetical protein